MGSDHEKKGIMANKAEFIKVDTTFATSLELEYLCAFSSLYLRTVKPHIAATSVIRPPHYSGQVWKVPTNFPYNSIE